MKKIIRIAGIVLLMLIAALFLLPIIFEDDLEQMLLKNVNKELKAEVSWKELDLSLLADFPDARLNIKKLSVVNNDGPFLGDTLLSADDIKAGMPITSLFDDNISIEYFNIDKAYIKLASDKNGEVNYLITKESTGNNTSTDTTSTGSKLRFSLHDYAISNSELHYIDSASGMDIGIKEFQHQGSGDFTTDQFTLKTKTDAMVSYAQDSIVYLAGNHLHLESDFAVDLEKMKFEFLGNELLINQLPLAFDGYYQLGDNADQMDISFSTPSSDFKNLLALIPEAYQKKMDEVRTTGEFSVNGEVKGELSDENIPRFSIKMKSKDASFDYPSLPKKAEHINLDILIENTTGLIEDTKVIGKQMDFSINNDRLETTFALGDLTDKVKVNFKSKGAVNLANIEQVYPMEEGLDVKGKLEADLKASFTMYDLENENFTAIRTNGDIVSTDLELATDLFPQPLSIKKASLSFTQDNVQLDNFSMTTGSSDIQANGNLQNLLGYALQDGELNGNLNLSSNKVIISELMSKTENETSTNGSNTGQNKKNNATEDLQLPDRIRLKADFEANEVVYDNMSFKNMRGKLSLRDQIANITQIHANTLSGSISGNASLDTKQQPPFYDSNLKLNLISITESMAQMNTLQKFAPIMNVLNGQFSTDINLTGVLKDDLTPDLEKLQGSVLANIQQAGVEPKKMELVNRLDEQLDFIKGKDLNLNPLKARLDVKNGSVSVKPFDFSIDDIGVNMSGSHSFSNQMNYQLDLKVPAKYFGNEVGGKLAQLSNDQKNKIKVDLPVSISGAMNNPNIDIDMKQAVKNLTKQIIQAQKDKLKDKATDVVKDKLNDLLGGDKDKSKNQQKEKVKDKAEDLLNDLLGGGKKKK